MASSGCVTSAYLAALPSYLHLSIHQFGFHCTPRHNQEFFKEYWIRLKARGVHIAQPMNRFYDWVRKANRAKQRGEKVTHSHTHMYAYMHAYIHTPIYAYIHTYIHAYMHTCMHTYIHACMRACIHTCMHAYIHTYIHTLVCIQKAWSSQQ